MVFVFHAVKRLIDSIWMDLQSTKVIFLLFDQPLWVIKIQTESSW